MLTKQSRTKPAERRTSSAFGHQTLSDIIRGRSQGYTPGLAQMPFTTEQAKRKGYINVLAGG